LAVRPELVNPALSWLAELDAESFRRLFRHSPVQRAKLGGLLRNVAIAMGNSGLAEYLPKLREWAASPDPVLGETAQWALARSTGETGAESGISNSP
jgi:epoxyqueuosine reductase